MHQENFIVREPLLDTKEQVLGFELAWQHDGPARAGAADIEGLAAIVGELGDGGDARPRGANRLFLEMPADLLTTPALDALPAQGVTLRVEQDCLADTASLAVIEALHQQGYGISLFNVEASQMAALPFTAAYCEIPFVDDDFPARVRTVSSVKPGASRMAARGVTDWTQFDTCAALGLDAFVGQTYLTSRTGSSAKGLNPAQTMILQLMDMVRQNADIRQLESVLKRDAALSYKLLRYINSAGFGLGCEIQSLRHAVTMLGYSPLYRWLSLLMATASAGGCSPILMQTAVIRGRFVELLGQAFLPRTEAENLFVTGMFSLLDRLLGVTMEQVLEKVQLSEAVSQALLVREGIYGPFLALAEACENRDQAVAALADSLYISAKQVNHAHLSALAWAQGLEL